MKIALFARSVHPEDFGLIQKIIKLLDQFNITPVFYKPFLNRLNNELNINAETFDNHNDIDQSYNFIFSIGGDGTLLDTLGYAVPNNIPIMGINTGRLGFLSTISPHQIDHALDCLLNHEYKLEERSLVELKPATGLFGNFNLALNEISIQKSNPTTMLTINVSVDGEYLNSYWGDGIMIATPTGSTAYSLSCGGPIMTPDSKNLIITPIAPHNLTVRPIVVPDTSRISLIIEGRESSFIVGLDSRTQVATADTTLEVSRAEAMAKIVRLPGNHFFTTIRRKLAWGLDLRN
ncbi:MAG TPA: NAD kinase [Bacteroidales bacterium]|nr:MAG: NAD kinase [Bacteroidetes bacterium GWE2_42_24]OFY29441.1 MAG: NAD kinase [Bacteroidetes bacterium GWF2_43_11]PKP23642.1 MAG: NAD kinase [Bacteroidetes bacterium HGW-Bacteroidetes-22]HBZ67884.1 NAD kinase [Bacteroidales bacterium]